MLTRIFIENLTRIASERDISLTALSQESGFSATAVLDIVNGRSRSPKLDTVVAVSQTLRVDPLAMLSRSPLDPRFAQIQKLFEALPVGEQEMLLAVAASRVAAGRDVSKEAG